MGESGRERSAGGSSGAANPEPRQASSCGRPPFRCCVVTGTRAEYGLLKPLIQALGRDPEVCLQLVATGTHLEPAFGMTVREIEADGLPLTARVGMELTQDSGLALARSMGLGLSGLAEVLAREGPDVVLCLGDRFELLSLACACLQLGLPLAHCSGGELTEGAIDDSIRHALTKLSHLHFVANETFARRLRQMGEEPWRITVSGDPGIDAIVALEPLPREVLERDLGLDLAKPTALVTFHPVTLELGRLAEQVREFFAALRAAGLQYILTRPNADPGNSRIVEEMDGFLAEYPGVAKAFPSLGHRRYLSLMRYARLLIGNSSSGLVEAPLFNLPAVNVGSRQAGRPTAANVVTTGYGRAEILEGIRWALAYAGPPVGSPFGDGRACGRIVGRLKEVLGTVERAVLLRKRFLDV